jgi:hypothetical protein
LNLRAFDETMYDSGRKRANIVENGTRRFFSGASFLISNSVTILINTEGGPLTMADRRRWPTAADDVAAENGTTGSQLGQMMRMTHQQTDIETSGI